jgi:hypothetical protein
MTPPGQYLKSQRVYISSKLGRSAGPEGRCALANRNPAAAKAVAGFRDVGAPYRISLNGRKSTIVPAAS